MICRNGMKFLARIAIAQSRFTKTGIMSLNTALIVPGTRKIATFAAARCAFTVLGIIRRRFTKNAANEKQPNGTKNPVITAVAQFVIMKIGTIFPIITKNALGMNKTAISAAAR